MSKLFWYIIYPALAIPVLTTIAFVDLMFHPKPPWPPKEWAKEEAERINSELR